MRAAAVAVALTFVAAAPAAAQQPAAKIDGADTAWMIVATALVLMMSIPGLALFYAGMVRKKNVLATMAQTFAATALGSVLWMVIGYSLTFAGGGRRFGGRLRQCRVHQQHGDGECCEPRQPRAKYVLQRHG